MNNLKPFIKFAAVAAISFLFSCRKKDTQPYTAPAPPADTTTTVTDTVKPDPMQGLFGVYNGAEHYVRYNITNGTQWELVTDTIMYSHVKVSRYGEGEVLLIEHFYKASNSDFSLKGDYWTYYNNSVRDTNRRKTFGYLTMNVNYTEHVFADDTLYFSKTDHVISGSTGWGMHAERTGHWKKVNLYFYVL